MFRKTTIAVLVLALICSFPLFSFGESESGASEDIGSVETTQPSETDVTPQVDSNESIEPADSQDQTEAMSSQEQDQTESMSSQEQDQTESSDTDMKTMSSEMQVKAASVTSNKVKRLPISLKSNMKSISVKWKKKKNIKRYVIYRIDVTKAVTNQDFDHIYKMSQYKKIAKVSRKKGSYKDKKVKNNHYYAYVVKAYKKVKGKYKLAYSSYDRNCYEYCCRGLGIPELLNGGDGENYTNSKSCIYLYHQTYSGVNPSSVILYRKAKGESKYKAISYKTVEKTRNLAGVIKDTTVKPGTIYYYKIRTKKKYNGKTYYSKLSKAIRIPAVNVTGKYTVSAIPVPDNPDEIIIGFTSDKYNGVLTISQSNWTGGTENDIRALEYSYDNVNWESMAGSKAVIEPGKTVYIKFGAKGIADITTFSTDEECEGSLISVSYDSPVFRYHIMNVDLVNNTAEVFPLYD